MAPAAVWTVERSDELALDADRLRAVAGFCVLAANFALLLLPPAVAAFALVGVIR